MKHTDLIIDTDILFVYWMLSEMFKYYLNPW